MEQQSMTTLLQLQFNSNTYPMHGGPVYRFHLQIQGKELSKYILLFKLIFYFHNLLVLLRAIELWDSFLNSALNSGHRPTGNFKPFLYIKESALLGHREGNIVTLHWEAAGLHFWSTLAPAEWKTWFRLPVSQVTTLTIKTCFNQTAPGTPAPVFTSFSFVAFFDLSLTVQPEFPEKPDCLKSGINNNV